MAYITNGHDINLKTFYSIRKKIKWKHKVSHTKGLEDTFKWYKDNLGYFKKISKKSIAVRLGLKL